MQQGGSPTPFDRNLGTKMGAKAVDWMICQVNNNIKDGKVCCDNSETAVLLGVVKRQYKTSSLESLKLQTNFE